MIKTSFSSFLRRNIADSPHVHLVDQPFYHFVGQFLCDNFYVAFICELYCLWLVFVDQHKYNSHLLWRAQGNVIQHLLSHFQEGAHLLWDLLLNLILDPIFVSLWLLRHFTDFFGCLFFRSDDCRGLFLLSRAFY